MGAIANALKAVDKLDGYQNSLFFGVRMYNPNYQTSICLNAEKKGYTRNPTFKATLRYNNGVTVNTNCSGISKKLMALVAVANKLPAMRFMRDYQAYSMKRIATSSDMRRIRRKAAKLTAADLFGFYSVHHMISAYMQGRIYITDPLKTAFKKIMKSAAYFIKAIRSIGRTGTIAGQFEKVFATPRFQSFSIRNLAGAYLVFKKLGRKYKFSTAAFKP